MSRAVGLLLVLLCLGFVVQPTQILVDGTPGDNFSYYFTILNDDPQPKTLHIELDPESDYLSSYAEIDTKTAGLLPGESINVNVKGTYPKLGPEKHVLKYDVISENNVNDFFELIFDIQGNQIFDPKMNVKIDPIIKQSPVLVELKLQNHGNIINYHSITLTLIKAGIEIKQVSYPNKIRVLPGEEKEINLPFAVFLDSGEYVMQVKSTVNNDLDLTQNIPFKIVSESETKNLFVGQPIRLDTSYYPENTIITYSIFQGDEEIITNTVAYDEGFVNIPTDGLNQGTYKLVVSYSYEGGQDSTTIEFELKEKSNLFYYVAGFLFFIILGLLHPRTWLEIKYLKLLYRINKKEKQLNKLVKQLY